VLGAVVIAVLTALVAGAFAVVFELARGRRDRRPESRRDVLARLEATARARSGQLTADEAADALGVSEARAAQLLRGLVDDETLTFGVDDRRGVVVFTFPALRRQAQLSEGAVYVLTRSSVPAPSSAPRARR
jgi:hypothetical protein